MPCRIRTVPGTVLYCIRNFEWVEEVERSETVYKLACTGSSWAWCFCWFFNAEVVVEWKFNLFKVIKFLSTYLYGIYCMGTQEKSP